MIPNTRLLWYAISGLILLLVQLNLGYITVREVAPDLLVILTVVIALREGQFAGALAGFTLGLFFDIISSNIVGTNALTKLLVGFIAGFFHNEQLPPQEAIGSFRFLGVVAIASLVHNLIFDFFYVQPTDFSFAKFFLRSGVAATLYTTVVSVLVMLAAARKQRW